MKPNIFVSSEDPIDTQLTRWLNSMLVVSEKQAKAKIPAEFRGLRAWAGFALADFVSGSNDIFDGAVGVVFEEIIDPRRLGCGIAKNGKYYDITTRPDGYAVQYCRQYDPDDSRKTLYRYAVIVDYRDAHKIVYLWDTSTDNPPAPAKW